MNISLKNRCYRIYHLFCLLIFFKIVLRLFCNWWFFIKEYFELPEWNSFLCLFNSNYYFKSEYNVRREKIQTNQSLSSYCSGRSYFIFDFVADCNAFEVHFWYSGSCQIYGLGTRLAVCLLFCGSDCCSFQIPLECFKNYLLFDRFSCSFSSVYIW